MVLKKPHGCAALHISEDDLGATALENDEKWRRNAHSIGKGFIRDIVDPRKVRCHAHVVCGLARGGAIRGHKHETSRYSASTYRFDSIKGPAVHLAAQGVREHRDAGGNAGDVSQGLGPGRRLRAADKQESRKQSNRRCS